MSKTRDDDAEAARSKTSAPTGSPSSGQELCRVGVRIPPFWPEDPEFWFAQIEGQFTLSGITSDITKFNYVISNLEHQYSREVRDLIIAPPENEKYAKLRAEIIKRFTASQEKRVKQLLMHEELGDRKPSQFLRHLQSLAGANVPEDFVRTIWSSRLPTNIQTVLAAQPSKSLEVLGDLADRVSEIAPMSPHVAAACAPSPGSSLDTMAREIAELRKQLDQMNIKFNEGSRSRRRRRTPSCSRSNSRNRSNSHFNKYPTCWYHWKFANKAQKCIKPCDFKPSENIAGGR